jgi:hypothetical protein
VPLWTIDLRPALDETIDTAAYTAAEAQSDPNVLVIVETALWENAGSPPAPGQSSAPASQGATLTDADTPFAAQATALVASASITNLGTNWGSTPLYMLTIPSLNMEIQVADTNEAAASSDAGAIAIAAQQLWENAGSPPAPVSNPAPQQMSTPDTSTDTPSASTTTVAAVPTVASTVASDPASDAAPAATSTSVTVIPQIKITISASAAKQNTVAKTLTFALNEPVTLASTVRLTSAGKVTTLAKMKSLLAKGKAVKVTLRKANGKYVVTGLAL